MGRGEGENWTVSGGRSTKKRNKMKKKKKKKKIKVKKGKTWQGLHVDGMDFCDLLEIVSPTWGLNDPASMHLPGGGIGIGIRN